MDLLTGKKRALREGEYKKIRVNKFQELNVNFAIQQAKSDPLIWKHIPDHWEKPKSKKDRDYLWMVLYTLKPDYVSQIVNHARAKRVTLVRDPEAREQITII